MFDLEPATSLLAALIEQVREEQLGVPTPCTQASLGDLLDHVDHLAFVFAAAATKTPLDAASQTASADASRLGTDWRQRIPVRLDELAAAWKDEAAWAGMTQAGGLDLPAEVAGVVALDEVVVHGWDIAMASGQPFSCEPDLVDASYEFVQATVAANPDGSPDLFGPPVPVPDDAPLFDRFLGLTGRDPKWSEHVRGS
jgi:uncharacterized protein (TIGR03086 family)